MATNGYYSEEQPRIFKDKEGFFYKNKRERAEEFYPAVLGSQTYIPIVMGIGCLLSAGFLSIGIGFFVIGIAGAAASVAAVVNTSINKKHSRKLFETIRNGDVREIEEKIDKISKKTKRNRKHILNDMRDKNGDTLISAIINSDKINEEKKEELIEKLIKNGAKIDEKNATFGPNGKVNDKIDGETPIEIVASREESADRSNLINFLGEKYKERLKEIKHKIKKLSGWRRFFNKDRLEKLNKKAEEMTNIMKNILHNYEEATNDMEMELDDLEDVPLIQ